FGTANRCSHPENPVSAAQIDYAMRRVAVGDIFEQQARTAVKTLGAENPRVTRHNLVTGNYGVRLWPRIWWTLEVGVRLAKDEPRLLLGERGPRGSENLRKQIERRRMNVSGHCPGEDGGLLVQVWRN